METFNDITLSKLFIDLDAVTVTAIGHTVDESLLDKLADKRFHLPHDYGAGLHSIVKKLSNEKSNSRALLIDEVKKDVSKQYSEQIKTLAEQLAKRTEEFQKLQENSAKQLLDTNITIAQRHVGLGTILKLLMTYLLKNYQNLVLKVVQKQY